MKYFILIVLTSLAFTASALRHYPVKGGFRNSYKELINKKTITSGLRIINGNEAVPHSLPYQAWVNISDSYGNYEVCGGSLISQNYILTSAWCARFGDKAEVFLGAHSIYNREGTQAVVTISVEIIIHENYDVDRFFENNIALLKLYEPVSFTDTIQPVRLPSRSDQNNLYIGTVAKTSGWGRSSSSDIYFSDVLNYVYLEVISNKACGDIYSTTTFDETVLCTSGKDHSGICGADKGGPLVTHNVQIGVSSFVASGCQDQYPSGFTRVTSFLDWIQEHSDVIID